MDTFDIISKILSFLRKVWFFISQLAYRFRFFLIWLFVTGVALYLAARITYWYKAVYEPAQELKANPPVSVDQIMESLDVTLGDFDMPQNLGTIYLSDFFFFSLTPEEVWNDEVISNLWTPMGEMGLEKITRDSDEIMEDIVSKLP